MGNKKTKEWSERVRSADDAIAFADRGGATVTPNAHEGFTRISTTEASVYVKPGRGTMSAVNKGRLKKWFVAMKLLALALVYLFLTEVMMPLLFHVRIDYF